MHLVLDSAYFIKNLSSFSGEWYIEAKIWVLGKLMATGVSLLSLLMDIARILTLYI